MPTRYSQSSMRRLAQGEVGAHAGEGKPIANKTANHLTAQNVKLKIASGTGRGRQWEVLSVGACMAAATRRFLAVTFAILYGICALSGQAVHFLQCQEHCVPDNYLVNVCESAFGHPTNRPVSEHGRHLESPLPHKLSHDSEHCWVCQVLCQVRTIAATVSFRVVGSVTTALILAPALLYVVPISKGFRSRAPPHA